MAIDFHKWKAEPSGMHSHAEHGNEEALAILSRFVFIAHRSVEPGFQPETGNCKP